MVKIGKAVAAAVAVAVLAGAGAAIYYRGDAADKGKDKKGAAAAVPVSVIAAQQKTVPVRVQAIGNVEAFSTVSLKARVDGQILEVTSREGQEVKKADVLFRIDPRPFEASLRQAEANALRDAAARDQARSQERRYLELLEKNFVSKEAYAQIRTNADTAEATAKASQAALENARLNLEYCTIRSPIDGFVGKVLLQMGNLVKANDTGALVVINQVKPVYTNFAVPEQELSVIRKYMSAGPLAVEVSAPKSDAPAVVGRLVFVDNAVDQTTGTIRMRAQFDNADTALWPGQFVNVSLRLYDEENAVIIPSRTLQTGPVGQFVYVIMPDMTAQVRKVTVSRNEGEFAVVAAGIKAGEQVVIRGALRLSAGAKVTITAEGGKAS
ncbi:MAG: efflux RND transporter periplasmic adaptor subunit [Betaproteobacteria bacterium]|nr:efflux RND transporter periplasmic adaptor subunit [Betaproteobacteria bacterium]